MLEIVMHGSHSCHNRPFCTFRNKDCEPVTNNVLVKAELDIHLSAAVTESNRRITSIKIVRDTDILLDLNTI